MFKTITFWVSVLVVLLGGIFIYEFYFLSQPETGREPVRPFSYNEEKVSFVNSQAGVTLAGTLTLPKGKGPFPAVVIISGAGPNLRDGYSLKPPHTFIVLSNYLTRHGIATLRYDKRGVGESSGNYENSTSLDFANDADSAVQYLEKRNEIDHKKIGLIGHSEGGIIAPLAAAQSSEIAFVITLAGPGVSGEKILLYQRKHMDETRRASSWVISVWQKMIFDVVEEIENEKNIKKMDKKIDQIEKVDLEPLKKDDPDVVLQAKAYWSTLNQKYNVLGPWGKFFLKYDPKDALSKLKCPILVIGGEKDYTVSPDDNFLAIKDALDEGKNTDYEIKLFPDMDHGLRACKLGVPFELVDEQQAVAPEVLIYVGDWIIKHTQMDSAITSPK